MVWRDLTYRQRAGAWLVVLLVLAQLANFADWVFIARREPTLEVTRQQVVDQLAMLAGWAAATSILLFGLWRRHRWARWFLKAGLAIQVIISCVCSVSVCFPAGAFPILVALSVTLRLTALAILSSARELRIYLSLVYEHNAV